MKPAHAAALRTGFLSTDNHTSSIIDDSGHSSGIQKFESNDIVIVNHYELIMNGTMRNVMETMQEKGCC